MYKTPFSYKNQTYTITSAQRPLPSLVRGINILAATADPPSRNNNLGRLSSVRQTYRSGQRSDSCHPYFDLRERIRPKQSQSRESSRSSPRSAPNRHTNRSHSAGPFRTSAYHSQRPQSSGRTQNPPRSPSRPISRPSRPSSRPTDLRPTLRPRRPTPRPDPRPRLSFPKVKINLPQKKAYQHGLPPVKNSRTPYHLLCSNCKALQNISARPIECRHKVPPSDYKKPAAEIRELHSHIKPRKTLLPLVNNVPSFTHCNPSISVCDHWNLPNNTYEKQAYLTWYNEKNQRVRQNKPIQPYEEGASQFTLFGPRQGKAPNIRASRRSIGALL